MASRLKKVLTLQLRHPRSVARRLRTYEGLKIAIRICFLAPSFQEMGISGNDLFSADLLLGYSMTWYLRVLGTSAFVAKGLPASQ